jgi:hypothetical protein
VVNELDRDDGSSTAIFQETFIITQTEDDKNLLGLHSCKFCFLSQSIVKMENLTNLLSKTTKEISDNQDKLNKINS